MSIIQNIQAREILDSRGNPTVEAEVTLQDGTKAVAASPSGASVGVHEVIELRDNDEKRYCGKGVLKAVENINTKIKDNLLGKDVLNQPEIDNIMIKLDGTPNKFKLGANAIIAVSLACAQAAANFQKKPLYEYLKEMINNLYNFKTEDYLLPIPLMNILNGGMHADNNVDIQEFMIAPLGAQSINEAIRMSAEVYHNLKATLKEKGLIVGVGDEGGFAPNLSSNLQAIEIIMEAINKAGYRPGKDICLAVDFAASYFYKNGLYVLTNNKVTLNSQEMIGFIRSWLKDFPIISVEDGLAEDDWDNWFKLNQQVGDKTQIIGDDLFATNPERLKKGIKEKVANAILVKPNQIGTLSETIEVIKIAKEADYNIIISHRSGETEDSFIADLAVACSCGQIKTGAPCRGERIIKYNRLTKIESLLGKNAHYAGWSAFNKFI